MHQVKCTTKQVNHFLLQQLNFHIVLIKHKVPSQELYHCNTPVQHGVFVKVSHSALLLFKKRTPSNTFCFIFYSLLLKGEKKQVLSLLMVLYIRYQISYWMRDLGKYSKKVTICSCSYNTNAYGYYKILALRLGFLSSVTFRNINLHQSSLSPMLNSTYSNCGTVKTNSGLQ